MSHSEKELQSNTAPSPFAQTFFHGTKADLKVGDLITVGFSANNGQEAQLRHVYFTATLDAAIWGAELARGDGRGRIYLVEATGPLEDDPNLTNKKFPGNPTMSYRSQQPLRVVGELTVWQGHAPQQVQQMQDALARLKEQGLDTIEN
ncbi:rifampin ADP-ribosylating transferase [Cnuella takakiae]|uniref:Rifampin ADP-ribosylating transferase n=1 Tax=Cnuella takakiae TaxID=1302690 RepID=A0A1M5I388_9BACT|nr:NAD(+)--rifampin ADP-ribosyltransferase [Cnuella takakiae]OLY91353.1 NAD(+)--rifampin ADP-ribosyltransferase [Cnuella takakiae]SHG22731.1 rifampin ADP-ribosylating transferase [Cnuella takakiae]